MPFNLHKPILYLITSGATSATTASTSDDYERIIRLLKAAVDANIDLIQIREKNLRDRILYDLSVRAREITRGSSTRLLINDRADIARASGADGVHLTTRSMPTSVLRQTFGPDFVIGVSTHSAEEVEQAVKGGADFAVFGPVFETESKELYGDPKGLVELNKVAARFRGFPILALGGINLANAAACVQAGASGIAAITLFQDAESLASVVDRISEMKLQRHGDTENSQRGKQ